METGILFYLKIYSWMAHLANKYPNLVQTFRIGRTHERRSIMALRVWLLKFDTSKKIFILRIVFQR